MTDNDSRGVSLTGSPLAVYEGRRETYTLVLDSQPTADVTITPSSNNSKVSVAPTALTFTPTNWETAQTVTVQVAEDTDGDDESVTITHTLTGGDYGLNSVSVGSVAVTVTDDQSDPRVASITRKFPQTAVTDVDILIWRVSFSKPMTEVDTPDFVASGTTALLNVTQVTDQVYDVTASLGDLASLNGTVDPCFFIQPKY